MKRLILLACGVALQAAGLAQTGALDPTFGNGGIVMLAPGTLHDVVYGMDLQDDGKVIFTGVARITSPSGFTTDLVIGRLNTDGTLDATFGTAGLFTYASAGGSVFGYDVEVLPDGSILACGGYSVSPSDTEFLLVRLTADGVLDPAFGGGDGIATYSFGEGEDYALEFAVNADGTIVLVGSSALPTSAYDRAIALRVLPDGTVDTSFGTEGSVVFSLNATSSDTFRSLSVLPDGRIMCAGYSYTDFTEHLLLVGLTPEGALDATFANSGVLSGSTLSEAFAVVASEDVLYVGGRISTDGYDAAISAFNFSGELLPDYGVGGSVSVNFNPIDFFLGMTLQPDGKLLAVGATGLGTFNNRDVLVCRYLPTGELDADFADAGSTIIAVSTSFEDGNTVLLQEDGRILISGFAAFTTNEMVFLRLLNEPISGIAQTETAPSLHLFPVPLTGSTLSITLPDGAQGTTECTLTDAAGRTVARTTQQVPSLSGTIALPLPASLPSGTYILQVLTPEQRFSRAVVK